MSDLYRKSSLEKLSGPEQLDKMIEITSPMFWIGAAGGGVILIVALLWAVLARLPINVRSDGIFINKEGIQTVYARDPGVVKEILVSKGETVSLNTVLARFDTEGTRTEPENLGNAEIRSSIPGKVVTMDIAVGSVLQPGSPVCTLLKTEGLSEASAEDTEADGLESSEQSESVVVCYVPISDGKKIKKGMDAMVYPSTVNRQEQGHIAGTVSEVADYVTSQEEMMNCLGDSSLVQAFTGSGPVIMVTVELEEDSDTASGYKWSSRKGSTVMIDPGTMVSVDIVTEEKAPITMLIPLLKEKLSVQREKDKTKNE